MPISSPSSIPNEPKRVALAALLPPLVFAEQLSNALNGAQIWLKRDDLTGLELSGNKIRKLEYILADALDAGCDTIVTEGTPQSNHCRATAAACAKLGLRAHLLLRPDPPTGAAQGNHLLDELFGASTRCFPRDTFDSDRDRIVARELKQLRAAGCAARVTPMGASEPMGCWGYIRAAFELRDQLAAAGIRACDVVTAISSGATYAGLLIGQALAGMDDVTIHGVPVSDDVAFHEQNIAELVGRTIAEFGLALDAREIAPRFVDGYVGEGYAIPYDRAVAALRTLARSEAIMLDPVYTAKAFCAVLDLVETGTWGRQRPVVFLHTGGIFSNFAWPELLG